MEMSKFRLAFITLCLLTFTVIAYDIHVFNTNVLGIEVGDYGKYSKERLESWDTAVNITDCPLKEKILYYVNKSILMYGSKTAVFGGGERIFIFDSEVADFLGTYYVSTWCWNCWFAMSPHFIDGDTYYHVLMRYTKVQPSLLDASMAWFASIATVILWIYTGLNIEKLEVGKTKMTFIGLGLLTTAWAIASYTCQTRYTSRTKVTIAGVFLLVMWGIFFLSLIVHEVYPRLKGRGNMKPELNTLEACSPPSPN